RGPRYSNFHQPKSCDLRPHRVKVGLSESFGEDCLDPVSAECPHERVRERNLVKPIDGRRLLESPLPCEMCEPPTLPTKFGKLRVSDCTPSLNKLFVCGRHVGTTSTHSRGRSL